MSPWAGDTIHRTGTLDNPWLGLPGGNPFPFDWQVTPKFLAGSVFIPFNPNLDTPLVQSWNATVEQQLAGSWLVSASYIGTKSERLWNTTAINGAIFLTPQSHPSLFTGPDTCVLEGVTFTPVQQHGESSTSGVSCACGRRRTTRPLLPDAALFANIDEIPLRQHARTTTACCCRGAGRLAVSTSTRTTRCRAA